MSGLSVVRILHEAKNRVLYNFIAEFFRFCGVFVCEDLIGHTLNGNAVSDMGDYQLSLYLSSENTGDYDRICVRVNPDDVRWKGLNYSNAFLKKDDWAALLGEIAGVLSENNIDFSMNIYWKLMEVFTECNVVKAAANLQYYRFKTTVHKESSDIFRKAVSSLKDLNKDREVAASMMYQYAALYCRQKVNQACFYQKDKAPIYHVYCLEQSCRRLISNYPDNANLWILLALITENSSDGYDKAASAYSRAADMIGNQPYASHLHYWNGLLFEKKKNLMRDAKREYARAYALQRKYRNIYKVAIMFEVDRDYDLMFEYLKKCLESLENYQKREIDALEMVYYYKVCALLCIKYMEYYNDAENCIRYGKMALDYLENTIEDKKYFIRLYGEQEAEKYQKVTLQRIVPRPVYQKLAMAYSDVGDMEECNKYRNMI